MTRPRRRRAGRLAVLALPALALLAACGSSGPGSGGPLEPLDAPGDWTAHRMGPVTVSAPGEWTEIEAAPGDDADEAHAVKAPGDGAGSGVHTTVTSERSRDALDAVENLRTVGGAALGAQAPSSAELDWPGAEAAGYLTYTATVPFDDDEVELRYEYLVLDLADRAQAIVAVVGPVDTYEELRVHDVLATARVD